MIKFSGVASHVSVNKPGSLAPQVSKLSGPACYVTTPRGLSSHVTKPKGMH